MSDGRQDRPARPGTPAAAPGAEATPVGKGGHAASGAEATQVGRASPITGGVELTWPGKYRPDGSRAAPGRESSRSA